MNTKQTNRNFYEHFEATNKKAERLFLQDKALQDSLYLILMGLAMDFDCSSFDYEKKVRYALERKIVSLIRHSQSGTQTIFDQFLKRLNQDEINFLDCGKLARLAMR